MSSVSRLFPQGVFLNLRGIGIYEVVAMGAKPLDRGKEAAAVWLAAAFMLMFFFFGWRYFHGGEGAFPLFYEASSLLDGYLEQAGQGLYTAVGNFLREAFFHVQADLL